MTSFRATENRQLKMSGRHVQLSILILDSALKYYAKLKKRIPELYLMVTAKGNVDETNFRCEFSNSSGKKSEKWRKG